MRGAVTREFVPSDFVIAISECISDGVIFITNRDIILRQCSYVRD